MPSGYTFLAALLLVLAFPTWNVTPLLWIGLIPFLRSLDHAKSPGKAFLTGLWMSFFFSVLGFYWVAYVLKQFGGLPWPVALTGLLLFGLIGQPQFYLFGYFYKVYQNRHSNTFGLISITGLSALYTGIDWVLPKLFADTLGHATYRWEHFRQIADIGGPSLITFIIVFTNLALWSAFKNKSIKKTWAPLTAIVMLLGLSELYGIERLKQVEAITSQSQKSVQMVAVQANIGDFDKIASEKGVASAANSIIKTYTDLSDQALALNPKPEFLVWPETAYPSTFRTPNSPAELERDQKLESYVKSRNVPVFFGGYDTKDKVDYNAFFMLSPDGTLHAYYKNILLYFGEYIPFLDQIKWLKNMFPQVANFGRGPGPSVYVFPKVKLSPVICYEILFPNYILKAVNQGSELILNATNDSWFGPTSEPELHLALTIFRSIESRVPQLRATNTGISALILPSGEVKKSTGLFRVELMNVSVPIVPRIQTLMLILGDFFGPLCFILGIIFLLLKPFLAHFSRNCVNSDTLK